jgi:hypothetical protein
VIDSGDQLREAFENHENLAPDPAAVYARVQELSRAYQRRRWGAQAAGGVVLAGALVAGGLVVPGLIGGKADKPAVTVAAGAAPSPGPTAIPVGSDLTKDWAAYFGAGYDYDNAVALAKIWKSKADIGTIKAQAGALLLAGKTLPVKPDPANVASAKEESEVNAFFEAGYTTEDAATLAGIWKTKDTYAAKVEGGTKLLAGQTLPIKPNPAAVKAAKESADLDAFASAGYSYQDAVTLQKLWKTKTVGAAKIEGGAKLLAGEKLPIKPHPAPTEDPAAAEADSKAVDKFFAAGYSYDDAAQLAKIWKLTDPYSAKIAGGKKLLAGQSLPIKP